MGIYITIMKINYVDNDFDKMAGRSLKRRESNIRYAFRYGIGTSIYNNTIVWDDR